MQTVIFPSPAEVELWPQKTHSATVYSFLWRRPEAIDRMPSDKVWAVTRPPCALTLNSLACLTVQSVHNQCFLPSILGCPLGPSVLYCFPPPDLPTDQQAAQHMLWSPVALASLLPPSPSGNCAFPSSQAHGLSTSLRFDSSTVCHIALSLTFSSLWLVMLSSLPGSVSIPVLPFSKIHVLLPLCLPMMLYLGVLHATSVIFQSWLLCSAGVHPGSVWLSHVSPSNPVTSFHGFIPFHSIPV